RDPPPLPRREPPVRRDIPPPTPGAPGAAPMMSRFPRRADAVLFLALSLATVALSATAVVGSLAFVGRTFPGFIVWATLLVVPLGRPSWTGIAACVPFRGRVKSVDG